jgi:hypothetical protein
MADITGRDSYIIGVALAYAIESIDRLPEEWQRESDRDDMEKLLVWLLGKGHAGTFREEARNALNGKRFVFDETQHGNNVVSIAPRKDEEGE